MSLRQSQQRGLTIIELMIALLIGAILMAAMINIFYAQKVNYTMQEGISRVQENGRVVQFLMEQDLRMAGLVGCNTIEGVKPTNYITTPTAAQTFTTADFIQGYQNSSGTFSPALPTWISNNILSGQSIRAGTDVLTVRRMDNTFVGLQSPMSSNSADLIVPNQTAFAPGDILFISDCEATDIFIATSGTTATVIKHSASGNSSASFSKAYQTDAVIGRLQVYSYYIRSSGRLNQAGTDIPVLVRQDGKGKEVEISDGVENMQIIYGVDTDDDKVADTFVDASTVNTNGQWNKVVSVRITNLINGIDETAPKAQPYYYLGVTTTPTDRLYRKQWESYISLRNRTI